MTHDHGGGQTQRGNPWSACAFSHGCRPERLEEYRERHEHVWAEMRDALRKAGWGNYSLFLADDGLLVGYLETDDYQAALDEMGATDVNSTMASGNGRVSSFLTARLTNPSRGSPRSFTWTDGDEPECVT